MQPLKLLNNVQKARLLHALLYNEMPDFISYLYEYSESVLDSKEEIRAKWKDPLFGVDFWFQLAEAVKSNAEKYSKSLSKSSNVFADQLFDGYLAIFSAHVLTQYAARPETSEKFKHGVAFFF